MNNLVFLFMRRLRAPLITLITVYAISVFGMTLIPGRDNDGNLWYMDFFHAFYFVSYMGTTIGFGEVPYEFTDAQRMWVTLSIYATVISWLYGIGQTLAVLQEPMFGRLMRLRGFTSHVSNLREPFYLVCGYGVTGSIVVKRLINRGIRVVVVDIEQDRIDALELDNLVIPVPALCADASLPDILDHAGLQHPQCIGVLALTNNDNVNLSIAIASKLLAPRRQMITRTNSEVTTANMASFGTDMIVDPFRAYADYMALAARAPHKLLAYDWLMNPRHRTLSSAYKHAPGRWIICGYGRFGRALALAFADEAMEMTIIDPSPGQLAPLKNGVVGVGTEAHTLLEAGVDSAVGIIAGTGNDADNLSIIMTARELNPKLTTVVRQNLHQNALIFRNSRCDFVMEPGRIIANRILAQLKTPLLPLFLEQLQQQDDVWAHTLINRMSRVVGDQELDSWAVTITPETAPAVTTLLAERPVTLRYLNKDPRQRDRLLPCFPLLLSTAEGIHLLPGELHELQTGDEVLFCGLGTAKRQMEWSANNYNVLYYLLTGEDPPHTLLARLLRQHDRASA
ncbi:MAG: potassium transporter TrkA [Oceanospirillales bacterium]|uniref:TrkA family protein n=1 Tax=Marinobacterium halophilum TaxID=267374 RepID=A0A2P8F4Q2_9GAMM|nr:potassium channel protein [Marinobacterium halophilum]MBR9829891.1 potassium transporter TrkA [Oceanospirillales bacterium]PSL16691.1 TrkA family protein [Marinobacterium halophilum]